MHFTSLLLAAGTASLSLAAPAKSKRASSLKFLGINESGPEFGEDTIPGTYGTEFTWPTLSTYDTFINKGFNNFRVNFLLERLIPDTLTGEFNANYLGNLTEQVKYITGKGAYATIVPHNYGRYYGDIIQDTDGFGKAWQAIAAQYKGNEKVIFDTNNEFHDMAGAHVAELNQAAIDGIRAAGATSQWINVEGNAYTGAWTWTSTTGTDGKTNAETMGDLSDPQGKLVYQMHQYLDSDGSGTSETCVSATIGSERLQDATKWLRDNNKVGIIGELAGAANDQCEAAVKDMLSYLEDNSDVWQGALWWAAGPWWGDYMFSVEPKDGPAADTYIPILLQYA